jgi:kynurenine formamidase
VRWRLLIGSGSKYASEAQNRPGPTKRRFQQQPDARGLVECRISAIGFDGPSADPVDSTTFELHRLWLSSGRMIIENVANPTQLPARSQIVVAPLKLARGNGGPARIFALLPDANGGP